MDKMAANCFDCNTIKVYYVTLLTARDNALYSAIFVRIHISKFCDSDDSLRFHMTIIFTALHVMQTRYCDEISVRPSVRPSVCPSHA